MAVKPCLAALGSLFLLSGQEPRIVVEDRPSCEECRISLTRVAMLGGAGDPAALDRLVSVTRDSRGRYFAGPNDAGGLINVYDGRGRFLRVLGRRGGGPGEFAGIASLFMGPGDSLHVFDLANLRLTVFTPELRVARTVPVPGAVFGALPQAGGEVVAQMHVPSRTLAGFTVHRLGADGRVLRSFGEVKEGYRPGDWTLDLRPLARAGDGGLWLGAINRYELEMLAPDGRVRRRLVRDAPWFRRWEPTGVASPFARPPPPAVSGIREDGDGRLWVVLRVADAGWRPAARRPRGGEEPPLKPAEAERLFDTLVEVIDPRTGRLLARARNPGVPFVFMANGLAYRPVERGDIVAAEILRIRLVHP